jgi:hypothetical protein
MLQFRKEVFVLFICLSLQPALAAEPVSKSQCETLRSGDLNLAEVNYLYSKASLELHEAFLKYHPFDGSTKLETAIQSILDNSLKVATEHFDPAKASAVSKVLDDICGPVG